MTQQEENDLSGNEELSDQEIKEKLERLAGQEDEEELERNYQKYKRRKNRS